MMRIKYYSISCAVSLLALLLLLQADFWRLIDQKSFDVISVFSPPSISDTDILIVPIDDASFNDIQEFWPWPREMHGRLLARLKSAGAKLVVFDLIFSEPSSFGELDDLYFAESMRTNSPVVLGSYRSQQLLPEGLQITSTEPLDLFYDAGSYAGAVGIYQDNDGVVRRVPADENALWAASLQLTTGQNIDAKESEGKLVRFIGDANSVPRVSYYRALDENLLPDEVFKDKIVLVGLDIFAAAELGISQDDRYMTPFSIASAQSMAGVELHANLMINQQEQLFVSRLPAGVHILLLCFLVLVFSGLFNSWTLKRGVLFLMLASGALVGIHWALFVVQQLFIPLYSLLLAVFFPFMTQGALSYQREFRQRKFITNAFSKYVSTHILDELLESPEKLSLGGQRKQVTILFTDIAGFTSISEQLEVEQVAALLQGHLTRVSKIIVQHGGTLDKYIGDAIMAFWGAPIDDPNQADNALQAAIAMQKECELMRIELAAKNLPEICMRIGIHSGEAVVGNMGSDFLFDYTCIGDSVNLAARLEGINKYYGTDIIVSDDTRQLLKGDANLQLADRVVVKGKSKAVSIFTVTDTNLYEPSEHAFSLYAEKKWNEAADAYGAILIKDSENAVAKHYLKQIQYFVDHDPGEDWDGVNVYDSK